MTQAIEPRVDIGSRFEGRYEILSELGSGSFGRVFKARQLSTGQLVAVKVLRTPRTSAGSDDANRVSRFRRETRLCAELSHPNIVRLIDSGETSDGGLYAAFEFVPGITLKDLLAAEGKLSVAEAVHLLAQVLDALSCAHARGVVHRDLKPENIMVTKTGARRNALVLDFGLGGFTRDAEAWTLPRITATQELLGTPCYAAPEQLRGEPPTTRSDLYSWGLIFVECLTGELPVRGASAQEVIAKQLGPEPVAIPQWLRNHPLGRVLELVTNKQADKRDLPTERLLHLLTTSGIGDIPEPGESRPDETAPERERRQLTIVCCRVTISADEGRQPDIEELDHLLQTHRAALADRVARAGGTVATILADRVFLVFGYPQAREDDVRRAARLAVEIARETALAPTGGDWRADVRVGVHTGLVIVRDLRRAATPRLRELTGLTPQIASQLVEHAGPGEVLVSLDTHRLLRQEFESEPAGDCAMRELSRALPVFRLTGERRSAAATESGLWASETPLIGRASQLQQLLGGWDKARTGSGGAVIVTGEAGIGKSRLLQELRRRVGGDAWIECGCAPENQTTPLRPVIDALLAMDRSVEGLLTRYGIDLAENMPLFAALLSMPLDARYAPLHLSAERQKELTLHALVNLVFKIAEERPIVLALENAHWADPTTLELLTQLIQDQRAAGYVTSEPGPRLYVVFTARPEFVPPWSGEDVAVMPLPRLMRDEVEQMMRAGLASGREVPVTLVEQVARRAEGVPLFVEEITRLVLESTRAGTEPNISFPPSGVEIPTSLRDLLTARLDGVSAGARDTAQLAATLGREFRYEMLQAVSPKDSAFLREDIAELGRAGLLFHRRSGQADNYLFRHALLRDAAYEAMTRPTRQSLHRRVARVLRQQFPDVEQHRPEILALHYEQGCENLPAAQYWQRAGDQALKHAAYEAAIQQLERGLELLHAVETSAERTRLEIDLLTTLGTALFLSKGFAATEVERTFALAWDLCEQLGEDIPAMILYGIWSVHLTRGTREATAKLIPRVRRLATRRDDPTASLSGLAMLGAYSFDRGDFLEAREHLASARRFYGTEAFHRFAQQQQFDGGLYCYAYEMSTMWTLGYADTAEEIRKELQDIAERSRNPYFMSIALAYGETLARCRGETHAALERSDRLIALATEQRLYLWVAAASCGRGGALQQQGALDEAITTLQQGLTLYRGIGVMSAYSYYLTYLAAAYRDARQVDEGLAIVDEGLSLCDSLVQRFHEAELVRLKGELLQLRPDERGAEAHFRRSRDIARRQQARAYELRAAVSLSRWLQARQKGDAARQLLGEVYGQFTEGFDTGDVREARALLAELA